MQSSRFMSFLLAGLETVPHSPGFGRAFSWAFTLLAASCVLDFAGCASAPHGSVPFAYVANEGSGTISIVDTGTDTVVGEIRTGGKPRGITASRDGRSIYVTDSPSSSLKVIDAAQRAVSRSVP